MPAVGLDTLTRRPLAIDLFCGAGGRIRLWGRTFVLLDGMVGFDESFIRDSDFDGPCSGKFRPHP